MKKIICVLLILFTLTGCAGSGPESKYYAIDHFNIKEDGEAFKEAFTDLTIATYSWYKNIEGSDGVYIMHYDYFPSDMMQEWKENGIYETVPEEDLHYYVASENYLADRGLAMSEEEKGKINSGVRLYLLPDTLSDEEAERVKAFLTEDALFGLEGEPLIATSFMADPRIEFRTYTFNGTLEIPGGGEIKDPVILAANTENMIFLESESLIATGVKDGYIRLTKDAFDKYAGKNLPDKLKSRKVTFKNEGQISN